MQEMIDAIFPKWIAEHAIEPRIDERVNVDGWNQLNFPPGFKRGQVPFLILLTIAVQTAASKSDKGKEVPFPVSMPEFGPNQLAWIAPIRTKPRRTYDEFRTAFSSEGSHTPYIIRRMLSSRSDAKKFRSFLQKVGKASGLFESIEIKQFGTPEEATAPFEVDAVLDSKALSLNAVGYGVSQSLPIFVELIARPAYSWFAIQQPEVHLHPRAQAALGDVFFEMAARDNKSFVIETHSDFTIDRFRINYMRKQSKLPDSQILFFERRNKKNTVTPLRIGDHGELPLHQPHSYRKFFVKEQMNLLGL